MKHVAGGALGHESSEYGPKLLHEIIECAAREVPDASAFLCGSMTLSFRDLNARANRLARCLRNRGVGSGALVAVCLPKSLDNVVAMLAVLKLGAAIIPVGSRQPRARTQLIMSDSAPTALVTRSELAPEFELRDNLEIVCLDQLADEAGRQHEDDLYVKVDPADMAWVFYTSGSTGKPKGVIGSHHATVARCSCTWDMQPVGPDEVYAQQMPIGSIDTIWELWSPAMKGTPVALIDTGESSNPWSLVDALQQCRATQVCLVPSHLNMLLESCPDIGVRLPYLRTWISTGEALSQALANKFSKLVPRAKLINQYGLTETIATATFAISRESTEKATSGGLVSIGGPIKRAEVHVLDKQFERVPANCVGELYLGGDCLASGYLKAPALTADRFVPNPFSQGTRLYRSGDLAKFHENGTIEYRGRGDRQVKLFGYRVELTEVEAALVAVPGVALAAVIAVRDGECAPFSLAAYVVQGKVGAAETNSTTIRQRLSERLPDYMVPNSIAVVEALPMTPSGKIDYLALGRAHAVELPPEIKTRGASSFEVGDAIATAWRKILQDPDALPEQNFFDIGGDSVSAIRLVKSVNDALNVTITLDDIYRYPSLGELTAVVVGRIGPLASAAEYESRNRDVARDMGPSW